MSDQSLSQEKWIAVVGYEGLYEVSNFGRVKSINRFVTCINGFVKPIVGRILKLGMNNGGKGYHSIGLNRYNRVSMCLVHRLVAAAFIDNPDNKPYVNHIDCDTKNNYPDNLEWCTAKENMHHAWDNGLMSLPPVFKGEEHHRAKLTETDVIDIRKRIIVGDKHKDIAADYSVSKGTIGFINRRETWTHI